MPEPPPVIKIVFPVSFIASPRCIRCESSFWRSQNLRIYLLPSYTTADEIFHLKILGNPHLQHGITIFDNPCYHHSTRSPPDERFPHSRTGKICSRQSS